VRRRDLLPGDGRHLGRAHRGRDGAHAGRREDHHALSCRRAADREPVLIDRSTRRRGLPLAAAFSFLRGSWRGARGGCALLCYRPSPVRRVETRGPVKITVDRTLSLVALLVAIGSVAVVVQQGRQARDAHSAAVLPYVNVVL